MPLSCAMDFSIDKDDFFHLGSSSSAVPSDDMDYMDERLHQQQPRQQHQQQLQHDQHDWQQQQSRPSSDLFDEYMLLDADDPARQEEGRGPGNLDYVPLQRAAVMMAPDDLVHVSKEHDTETSSSCFEAPTSSSEAEPNSATTDICSPSRKGTATTSGTPSWPADRQTAPTGRMTELRKFLKPVHPFHGQLDMGEPRGKGTDSQVPPRGPLDTWSTRQRDGAAHDILGPLDVKTLEQRRRLLVGRRGLLKSHHAAGASITDHELLRLEGLVVQVPHPSGSGKGELPPYSCSVPTIKTEGSPPTLRGISPRPSPGAVPERTINSEAGSPVRERVDCRSPVPDSIDLCNLSKGAPGGRTFKSASQRTLDSICSSIRRAVGGSRTKVGSHSNESKVTASSPREHSLPPSSCSSSSLPHQQLPGQQQAPHQHPQQQQRQQQQQQQHRQNHRQHHRQEAQHNQASKMNSAGSYFGQSHDASYQYGPQQDTSSANDQHMQNPRYAPNTSISNWNLAQNSEETCVDDNEHCINSQASIVSAAARMNGLSVNHNAAIQANNLQGHHGHHGRYGHDDFEGHHGQAVSTAAGPTPAYLSSMVNMSWIGQPQLPYSTSSPGDQAMSLTLASEVPVHHPSAIATESELLDTGMFVSSQPNLPATAVFSLPYSLPNPHGQQPPTRPQSTGISPGSMPMSASNSQGVQSAHQLQHPFLTEEDTMSDASYHLVASRSASFSMCTSGIVANAMSTAGPHPAFSMSSFDVMGNVVTTAGPSDADIWQPSTAAGIFPDLNGAVDSDGSFGEHNPGPWQSDLPLRNPVGLDHGSNEVPGRDDPHRRQHQHHHDAAGLGISMPQAHPAHTTGPLFRQPQYSIAQQTPGPAPLASCEPATTPSSRRRKPTAPSSGARYQQNMGHSDGSPRKMVRQRAGSVSTPAKLPADADPTTGLFAGPRRDFSSLHHPSPGRILHRKSTTDIITVPNTVQSECGVRKRKSTADEFTGLTSQKKRSIVGLNAANLPAVGEAKSTNQTKNHNMNAGLDSQSESPSQPEEEACDNFVNYGPKDGNQIMSGVAPSGSSKTKARREREARERSDRQFSLLHSIAARAGVDINEIKGENL
ncbi:hypothetical protein BD289DRAFT_482899 [Coniella lustricola]|uniref:Uncharacterized protein n=1 Tax=Coniella lustricola TaxID=2025994 RepID=A0A2T3A7B3_9PEZI|nr:hypothetical protein BD289DRAFT_482899 [Coniella lustricola]